MSKDKSYVVKYEDIPYEKISIERVLTGYPDLDFFNKGIESGVTEIVGDTNTGKSILTSGLIDSAIAQHYKVGVFAGEHTLRKYKMLLMQQNAKAGEFEVAPFIDKNDNETNIADWYVNEECQKRVNEKYTGNLFLYDVRREDRGVEDIESFVVDCYKNYGVRFFVIDNLMEIDNNSVDQYQEQTRIITRLRNLSIRYNLFVCMVMHTNKSAGVDGFRLTVKNAFGSSNITNKAYNVWFIYRKDQIERFNRNDKVLDRFKMDCAECGFDYEQCDAFVEVAKTKGNKNGVVGLIYHTDTKTFTQANKINQTEADKIYKRYQPKQMEQKNMYRELLQKIDEDECDIF